MRFCIWLTLAILAALSMFATDAALADNVAEFIGRTTQPVALRGKQLPAGTYIPIYYDGGADWVTTKFPNAPRVPKSSVDLLPYATFTPGLQGKAVRAARVPLAIPPSLDDYPATLADPDGSVRVPAGATLVILARQGDDYLFTDEKAGVVWGRMPISSVKIVAGSPASGVPIAPQAEPGSSVIVTSPSGTVSARQTGGDQAWPLPWIAGGVAAVLIVVGALFLLGRSAPAAKGPKSQLRDSDLQARIEARFPSRVLPRVPELTRKNFPSMAKSPLLSEDRQGWWEDLLNQYPTAPLHEEEREQREFEFWTACANQLSVMGTDGKRHLSPKQTIFGVFVDEEKWIFRKYFAATGMLNRSFCVKLIFLAETHKLADDYYERYVARYENSPRLIVDYKEASRYLEEVRRDEVHALKVEYVEHMEKWREWFYFHVREAFNAADQKSADRPTSPITPLGAGIVPDLEHRPRA